MIWAESRSTRHDRREEFHKDSIQRAAECYRALQMDACDWVTLGTTKTAMVYGLGSKVSTHRE